jgi:hypothetical protein
MLRMGSREFVRKNTFKQQFSFTKFALRHVSAREPRLSMAPKLAHFAPH